MFANTCHAAVSPQQSRYLPEPLGVWLIEDIFGTFKNEAGKMETVRRFTFFNRNGMRVELINYGATITKLCVPDRAANVEDVVLGFDTIEEYLGPNNPYFGCIVGRVANRIGKGTFSIKGQEYNVTRNRGTYHLHGGKIGFDKALWDAHVDGNKVVFSYVSKCGEEGYPGHVLVQATYEVTSNNGLILVMTATSTKPTPVNLTNHSYFNLAGHNKGRNAVLEHTMCINASRFTEVDHESIPTGELKCLADTKMDLQVPRSLDHVLSETGGIDHNYCINHCDHGGLIFVARATHPPSGRFMEVYSDQPGVQFYTANFLPDTSSGNKLTAGKKGAYYMKQGAFCLETQNFPDAVNHMNFPESILKPGQTYTHKVIYQFGVLKS